MIVDLHVHLADLIVIAMFAAAGVCLVVWAVACFLRWAWGWLMHDRPPGRVREWWYGYRWWLQMSWPFRRTEDDDGESGDEEILKEVDGCPVDSNWLAPERTWEQMTSHQLPLETQLVGELERQGWFDADVQARLRAEYEARRRPPLEASRIISPGVWVTDAWSQERRERRAPWWEAEHRAAYESMGFEYPSGLMARVREAAQ